MGTKKNTITVAYQGIPGAYSEQAALSLFGPQIELLPQHTFAQAFQAVESKEATWALLPMENSVAGSIGENFDLLYQSPLVPKAEYGLKISHCLLGRPKARLKTLEKVYSHPQALAQCGHFLSSLGDVEIVPFFDTAGAAKHVASSDNPMWGAIASARAAEHYGLNILKKSIQNRSHNTTRFLALSLPHTKPLLSWKGQHKFTLCFIPKKGSEHLLVCLAPLVHLGLKVAKIEARPLGTSPWQYVYFLDFLTEIETLQKLTKAMINVASRSTFFKSLGPYPVIPSQ